MEHVERVVPGNEGWGIIVHPNSSASTIIITMPGYRGSIDGYNLKYRVLARYMCEQGLGAVVQMPNIERPWETYYRELLNDFDAVMEHVRVRAREWCATNNPAIHLMGFSAGGSTIATVAYSYPEVKKILLLEPSGHAVSRYPTALARYRGEAYIVVGDAPDAIGPVTGKAYLEAFISVSRRELVILNDCDHQFKGTKNGQIMAKAPFWAFAGDTTFPSPEGGLVLY